MRIFIAGNVSSLREQRVIDHNNENRLLSFYYLKQKKEDASFELYKNKIRKGEIKLHEDK